MFELYSEEKKAKLFDEITGHFFNRNFGSMSKSDYETLLFRIVLDYLREKESGRCSDYQMSKILGISQSRIRNLKIKAELVYPRKGFDEDWKKAFTADVRHAKYDENSGLVKMNIRDITVLFELRHYMENNGWYDEYQLNPKLFQCPLDVFISLCQKMDEENLIIDDKTKKKLKELEKQEINAEEKTALDLLQEGNYQEAFSKMGKKISKQFLEDLLEAVPFGKTLKMLLEAVSSK